MQTQTALDPAMVAAGRIAFTTNCSFCHGTDAHGGAEGGPDLTRSIIVTSGPLGEQLSAFLKVGRPPRMPAMPSLDAQAQPLAAFVRQQALAATLNGRGDPKIILVGNPKMGEVFFNGAGKCVTCHSVTGNLKGIGSKYDPRNLQGRIIFPRGHGGYPGFVIPGQSSQTFGPDVPRTVTITVAPDQVHSGDLVNISDFIVSLREPDGSVRTFARDGDVPRVEIKDPLHEHLRLMYAITNEQMHDLTAYLVTIK